MTMMAFGCAADKLVIKLRLAAPTIRALLNLQPRRD